METHSKRNSLERVSLPVRATAKTPEPRSKPFLRFYHSASLRKQTLAVLGAIEQAENATEYSDDLADIIVELLDSGMDYYFMQPLKLAKAGFIVEQSANLGMAATEQVMGSVVRNIIAMMDTPQLLSVCGSIRRLML